MIYTLEMSTVFLELLSLLDIGVGSSDNKKQTYPLANKKQASKSKKSEVVEKTERKKSEVVEKTGNIEPVTPIS